MPALLLRRVVGPGLIASLAALVAAFPIHASEHQPVIVHEWGTFTSLQDESGQAVHGINVDDEPAPTFVCQDGGQDVIAPSQSWGRQFGLPPYMYGKSWLSGDPAVTMRLETPVLYIYPPKGKPARSVPPLNVHVDFHGGVLSQYYPEAKFDGLPLIPGTTIHHGSLTSDTTTSLTWSGVRLGSTRQPVESDDHVWTTPREVSAPLLEVKSHRMDANGKPQTTVTAEHFLFYRGVGHLDSPMTVSLDAAGKASICGVPEMAFNLTCPSWMVEIRPDGMCAFRIVKADGVMSSGGVSIFPGTSSTFADSDFSTANLDSLKASMQAELVKQGLYADEAAAMLRTWELSYFKSPGLRYFYVAPRAWVEKVLPLQVTGAPVEITRVMIGRIELISNSQKAALGRLAAGPCPDLNAIKQAAQQALDDKHLTSEEALPYYRGDKPLRDLGISIPPLVQDYLDLGRFRDALILREQKLHPSAALAEFIQQNRLGPQVTTDGGLAQPSELVTANAAPASR